VIFVLGLQLLAAFPIHGMSGGMTMNMAMKPSILIVGHQWWWEIHYLDDDVSKEFMTANEIHIPTGQDVNIELETRDVMHSFWVPALHGKVDLVPGQSNFIRINANAPGEYQGQCAEYCGAQHAHMRLFVVAESPAGYERWKETQLADGAAPSTPDETAGQNVFLGGACALCHTVRGTAAGGTVAPDLTHVGSRRYIAGNSFPNNDAYLEAWATHAQSLKPEAQMPDLAMFTGVELRQLVAYLRHLQ
jgi:cytochrome c oxidase subunit 2